ncbi:MAG: DUF2786 domain-containing protein [Actinomycetota bacterium]|nr:DUF2786 domain-containing protein [Actinomycetota bacterium]
MRSPNLRARYSTAGNVEEPWRLLTDETVPTPGFAREVLLAAVVSHRDRDPLTPVAVGIVESLPPGLLVEVAGELLLKYVASNWAQGWLPAELFRQARLGSSPVAAKLAGWAIATDHVNRRSTTLDRRWVEQIEALGLPLVDGKGHWLFRWSSVEQLPWRTVAEATIDLLANLIALPPLERVLPPPGSPLNDHQDTRRSRPLSGTAGDPVLEKIRNLLAKAESSTFGAEALAFSAKAHELMTRHAIDALTVAAPQRAVGERPVMRRVFVDAPYVSTKSYLLQVVAEAARCRAFLHDGLAMSTVVGFADDIAAVEVLFTSLLLQAQSGLIQTAKVAPPGAAPRSKVFRTSFLTGFTHRIAERLRQVNEAVLADAEAEHGGALVPLLQSRQDDIDAFMQQFDIITRPGRRHLDGAGYISGLTAADRAQLNNGFLVGSE